MPRRDSSRSPDRRRTHERERDDRRRERRREKERASDCNRERDRDRDRDYDRKRERRGSERERDRRRDERKRDRDRDDRDRERDYEREGSRRQRARDRSRSRERSSRARRSPSRTGSESSEDLLDLDDLGVGRITEEDFFLKAGEFRFWLKEERGKYLDQLSSAAAHKYFRRFVRRWNDGALPRACYAPHHPRAAENTAYKWTFTEGSRFNSQEIEATRASVDRMTHPAPSGSTTARAGSRRDDDSDDDIGPRPPSASQSPGPQLPDDTRVGPAAPTVSERQLAREVLAEEERLERNAERRANRRTALERAEETVPRQVGREGKQAEKRAANEKNREMRDKDAAAGLEVDEGTLMGDDGGFAAALRAREASSSRRAEKRAEAQAELRAAAQERAAERREKESATMDMLKAIAKERFGR